MIWLEGQIGTLDATNDVLPFHVIVRDSDLSNCLIFTGCEFVCFLMFLSGQSGDLDGFGSSNDLPLILVQFGS